MKRFLSAVVVVLSLVALPACGGGEADVQDPIDQQLNQIMAAKTRFALSKTAAPVLNTHEWDTIFGGADGKALKYDRFGEIDELVFVALPGTFFNVQRQIRKETRSGKQTIYYKVTSPAYSGSQPLWIDGRFLDLRDVRPEEELSPHNSAKTLLALRRFEGAPYTWHGSHPEGVADLLSYYPPADPLTARESGDWKLKGFDSVGMLYHASNGASPLSLEAMSSFGQPVFVDLSGIEAEEGDDNPQVPRRKQAEKLLTALRPLDVIRMGDRMWVVLDGSQIIESRYRSKFDGGVQVTALIDTLEGLLEKSVYVKNPFQELEDPQDKVFFIRRYADTSSLLIDQVEEGEGETNAKDQEPSANGEESEGEEGSEGDEGSDDVSSDAVVE